MKSPVPCVIWHHAFSLMYRRVNKPEIEVLYIYMYTFIVKQHHSLERFPWCDKKIINKMKQKGVILFNKGSWIRWLTAKLLSVRSNLSLQLIDLHFFDSHNYRNFLLHGSCLTACGYGYYNYTDPVDSHSSCQLCDTSCLSCDGPAADQCTSCVQASFNLTDGECLSPCPTG